MKTHITYYNMAATSPEYQEMKANRTVKKLRMLTGNKFGCFSKESTEVVLETKHLFKNQWNTEDGRRVFDWFEEYQPHAPNLRIGHYLVVTEEMKQVRHNRWECGYCGHQTDDPQNDYHLGCLGSKYLEEKHLSLTKYRRVDDAVDRPEEVPQELKDLFSAEQQKRRAKEAVELRQRIVAEAEKAAKEANLKADVFCFLLDNGIDIDNVIFYSHKNEFHFGWRNPIPADELAILKRKLATAVEATPAMQEIEFTF